MKLLAFLSIEPYSSSRLVTKIPRKDKATF